MILQKSFLYADLLLKAHVLLLSMLAVFCGNHDNCFQDSLMKESSKEQHLFEIDAEKCMGSYWDLWLLIQTGILANLSKVWAIYSQLNLILRETAEILKRPHVTSLSVSAGLVLLWVRLVRLLSPLPEWPHPLSPQVPENTLMLTIQLLCFPIHICGLLLS